MAFTTYRSLGSTPTPGEIDMAIKFIRIDEHKCVGAGQCVLAAPEVFDQMQQGIGVP